MGFHEDDRIRRKNEAFNSAEALFEELKSNHWSVGDILAYANEGVSKDSKNEVMNALIRLCSATVPVIQEEAFDSDSEEPTYWYI